MSFLGDIMSTIGGDKAPAPPVKPPSRPSSTKPQAPATASAAPAQSASSSKPVYKGTAGGLLGQQSNGVKRKADDAFARDPTSSPKSNDQAVSTSNQKLSKLTIDSAKSNLGKQEGNAASSTPTTPVDKPASKAPAKGSYAALMAKAKEAQQTKGPSAVGMIKHQAVDKTRPSKLADRKKEAADKSKDAKPTISSRPGSSGKPDKRRSASPVKRGDTSKGIKPARPPLNAPQYKGTMGTSSKKREEQRGRGRNDEYLGTDEEDEGDYDNYGGRDDYYSDASSDMEGGFDDLEMEEAAALRAAKDDDARELALENKLKKDKLDRKQKLQAMASKRR